MNIAEILERQADASGDRVAIVHCGRRITFAELNHAAARAASVLSESGLTAGARVLVMSPMSISFYTTLIGLFRLGATAILVDPSAGMTNLAKCIGRARPDAFVAVPRAHLLRLTSAAVRGIPRKVVIRRPARDGHVGAVRRCPDSTPAIITFTSGTTGEAKGVVRTHGFLRAQHQALVDSIDLQGGETDLTTLPVFLLANLASGITSIIPDPDVRNPGRIDAAALLNQLHAEGPSRTVASPALLERLASHAERKAARLDSLRKVFTGGGPVFPRTLDALSRVAPHASIAAVYGSTEAEPIAVLDRSEISASDRDAMQRGAGVLAGVPVRSAMVRVIPDRWGDPLPRLSEVEFESQALPSGAAGEIVVGGEHVLTGYLDAAGDEETKVTVGAQVWHRTGDAGYFDHRGRLWLLGRCSAKVSDQHGLLYPLSVECAASEVPGVVHSAFLSHGGRRMLVIEQDPAADPPRAELTRLLGWAHLDDVLGVARMPVDRRHNAKTDLAALRRLLPSA